MYFSINGVIENFVDYIHYFKLQFETHILLHFNPFKQQIILLWDSRNHAVEDEMSVQSTSSIKPMLSILSRDNVKSRIYRDYNGVHGLLFPNID